MLFVSFRVFVIVCVLFFIVHATFVRIKLMMMVVMMMMTMIQGAVVEN